MVQVNINDEMYFNDVNENFINSDNTHNDEKDTNLEGHDIDMNINNDDNSINIPGYDFDEESNPMPVSLKNSSSIESPNFPH